MLGSQGDQSLGEGVVESWWGLSRVKAEEGPGGLGVPSAWPMRVVVVVGEAAPR